MEKRSAGQLELDLSSPVRQLSQDRPTLVVVYSQPSEHRDHACEQRDRKLKFLDNVASYARSLPW